MAHAEDAEGAAEDEDDDAAWVKLFRRLSENQLWTPSQISELTLPQLWFYLGPGARAAEGTPVFSQAGIDAIVARKAMGNVARL